MSLPVWKWLHGQPTTRARFKVEAQDFEVIEDPVCEPDGAGEHILVKVRKRGENTAWVAGLLAKAAGVNRGAVTWAGLKDRHAVTEQWFGIHLPGKDEPDLSVIESDAIQILHRERHSRKLRTGALRGNFFRILLRDISWSDELEARLEAIGQLGVPNYFGSQRFGRQGSNLETASAMFGGQRIRDRDKRSLALSAARSFLFNEVISARIEAGLMQTVLAGDCLMLAGSHSFFVEDEASAALQARLDSGDVQLTAPLWGRGTSAARGEALAFETAALAAHSGWLEGLEQAGLNQERRALCLQPKGWSWSREAEGLRLAFWLPAGCFATSVLRELVELEMENGHEDSAQ